MAKLNDLIRCEDAIKEISKRTCTPGVLCPDAYCKEVKEWITDDMVVDAVPVRCKNCTHYNAGYECLIDGYGVERDPEWFCGDGERKDGDGNG